MQKGSIKKNLISRSMAICLCGDNYVSEGELYVNERDPTCELKCQMRLKVFLRCICMYYNTHVCAPTHTHTHTFACMDTHSHTHTHTLSWKKLLLLLGMKLFFTLSTIQQFRCDVKRISANAEVKKKKKSQQQQSSEAIQFKVIGVPFSTHCCHTSKENLLK